MQVERSVWTALVVQVQPQGVPTSETAPPKATNPEAHSICFKATLRLPIRESLKAKGLHPHTVQKHEAPALGSPPLALHRARLERLGPAQSRVE